MSADEPRDREPEPGSDPEVLRLESSNSIWLFEVGRMRFRRVPRGTDPGALSVAAEWQPYFGLEVEPDTGAFTVALNEDGTRRLRAVRVDAPDATTAPASSPSAPTPNRSRTRTLCPARRRRERSERRARQRASKPAQLEPAALTRRSGVGASEKTPIERMCGRVSEGAGTMGIS